MYVCMYLCILVCHAQCQPLMCTTNGKTLCDPYMCNLRYTYSSTSKQCVGQYFSLFLNKTP